LHPNDDNVAQARGPKIRPKLGVSCRRLQKTGFRARMNEIKSGIPCSAPPTGLVDIMRTF
jgi:hypothetical protein